jgi:phosphoribosylamine--glycine ligase
VISGLDRAAALPGALVFHAGTVRRSDGAMTAAGGRVLAITGVGPDLPSAIGRAYAAVDAVDWPEGFHRRDIGQRALEGSAP